MLCFPVLHFTVLIQYCMVFTCKRRQKMTYRFCILLISAFPIAAAAAYMASNRTQCSRRSDKTLLILSTDTGFSITPSIPTLMQFSLVTLSVFPASATISGLS
ncbi:hypothetical protein OIU78_014520 [Salix suchowensis]|nr:hypothetical protein OIU78_014520 [Salix suchowensis]